VLAQVRVRGEWKHWVRLVYFVCVVMTSSAWMVSAKETASTSPATTQLLDLSSPALFPTAEGFPSNIDAPPFIVGLMRRMWVASPTFRRQCLRIARARGGRVAIEVRKPTLAPAARALSTIEHRRGAWLAKVSLFLDRDLVELIAHEFEHILEQIDGVDLLRYSKQGLAGVTPGSSEHYETARAIAVGRRVAAEYATSRDREAS
jgi:hypothetical protein